MVKWVVGDRLYDEDWSDYGTVTSVDDDGVISVKWDGGGLSDFTPDEKTTKETL